MFSSTITKVLRNNQVRSALVFPVRRYSTLRYSTSHEWARMDTTTTATVGLSEFATKTLGDIVYIELPVVGKKHAVGDTIAVVESTKAASEIYAPVAGEITSVNNELEGSPEDINEEPTGNGWIWKMSNVNKADFDKLMDEAAYKKFTEEQ
ncbi:glycine cleavage system H-protein [Cavenderia fasciculata]|uniref:Glycine cleavage system H protein n=1 Tax=Cavenderia fasciculata TaxID=261658 RepID=F4PQI1_CACFS|nr:glycine cleavage system H-protein [Cavenderia fasciculata]EGG22644.1 glycine cleavage system H-protein [Cavenderia fasciculata]|eukprot:XP_004360495.1 glycine cleavage system H-protein [Cavenderia fasciculata]